MNDRIIEWIAAYAKAGAVAKASIENLREDWSGITTEQHQQYKGDMTKRLSEAMKALCSSDDPPIHRMYVDMGHLLASFALTTTANNKTASPLASILACVLIAQYVVSKSENNPDLAAWREMQLAGSDGIAH